MKIEFIVLSAVNENGKGKEEGNAKGRGGAARWLPRVLEWFAKKFETRDIEVAASELRV